MTRYLSKYRIVIETSDNGLVEYIPQFRKFIFYDNISLIKYVTEEDALDAIEKHKNRPIAGKSIKYID